MNLAVNFLFLIIGAGILYLVVRLYDGQQARRRENARRDAEIADLRRQVAELQTPDAVNRLRLKQRRELEDMVALQELVAKDALDVLGRMSPDRIQAVFREVAPHLFFASTGDELPGAAKGSK